MSLHRTPLVTLAQRCREETDNYFKKLNHDMRFCFEIFRRASERQDDAWEVIYSQYRALFSSWITRNSQFYKIEEELDDVLQRFYLKFFNILVPEKFAGFKNLKSLLRYAQMIVGSIILDIARGSQQKLESDPIEEDQEEMLEDGNSERPEDAVARQLRKQSAWRILSDLLNNEKEEIVMTGLFSVGLKPREIQKLYPDLFPGSKDVSRIKENVLLRLKRDVAFLEAFEKI